MKYPLLIVAFFIGACGMYSQNRNIDVKYVSDSEKIKIDGNLDEDAWNTATISSGFQEHFPDDIHKAKEQTEIRMLFGDKYLYIGVKAFTIGSEFNMTSLMRDFKGGATDAVSFLFDTFSDNNNAFMFSVTPFGVVKEGLLSRGGVNGEKYLDLFWDTTWIAESTIHSDHYNLEIRIPLFALKFNDNVKQWRFNCYREDTQVQVNSTWASIPRNQELQNLGYAGTMSFEKPLKKSRNPISLIPYALYAGENVYFEGVKSKSNTPNAGLDVKIPIASSLNLDLTINPDFSNTSVNEGSTNTTRFELDLPEQRQFFLDNSDLFAGFGTDKQANPFYSRRIGYAKDTEGNDIQNDILAGARLTGKIGKDLRIELVF